MSYAKVRIMQASDYEWLPEFLYQALYIPEGEECPPREIINDPNIFIYIKDFGTQPGDLGMVAEQNGQIIGAAWTRIIPAYGHIDKNTPELAISVLPEFRSNGIGSKLMRKLFWLLRKNGYKQTSLSVQKGNPAVRFYQRLGYTISGERLDHAGHEDFLMIKELNYEVNHTSEQAMRILDDADACPVKEIILRLAKRRNIPVTMVIDTSHELEDDYSTVITVDKGSDSADYVIVNMVTCYDILLS